MLDEERCRRILHQSLPQLNLHSVRYFAQGWDYELWEVNHDLLFRFPKRPQTAEPLARETRLLAELADALSTPVPRPQYVAKGCADFPFPFTGYRKLPGRPLDEATLDEGGEAAIARQVSRFLSELHRFTPARAVGLGVPDYTVESWRKSYQDFRETVRREVLPLLSAHERSAVESLWRRFLDDERHFRFEPVLLHADLSPDHVLVDAEHATVTGIIDFGDAMVGDPALDFTGFDAGFRQAVLAGYNLPVDDTLMERTRCYRDFCPFHEVLFGLETHDEAHLEAGLADIRRQIVRGE